MMLYKNRYAVPAEVAREIRALPIEGREHWQDSDWFGELSACWQRFERSRSAPVVSQPRKPKPVR
jgi:hypothetical protein